MRILVCFTSMIIIGSFLSAQTLPERHILEESSYIFSYWSSESGAASYPLNMMFHTANSMDPDLNDEMTGDWTLPYNLTSGSRLTGMNDHGISFLNTSVKNDNSGYLGAAVVGLNTKGCKNIRIDWTGRTITPNERVYSIALQYKTGNGKYENTGAVYLMNSNAGSSTEFENIKLPKICEDRDSVYIRWKYFFTSNDAGARAELGLDDIVIKADKYSGINKNKSKGLIKYSFTGDKIYIESDKYMPGLFEILIYNLSGQLIIKEHTQIPFIYNTDYLPEGIYLLSLNNAFISDYFMFSK